MMLGRGVLAVCLLLLFEGTRGAEMRVTAKPKTVKPKGPHIQHQIRRGEIASHAVNLGGWLVAEGWMTYNSPLWADVPKDQVFNGEYNAMKLLGPDKGVEAFEAHRKTWITEADIQEIAAAGLNTVRVPVGYWIMTDDPVAGQHAPEVSKVFAPGSLKYLDTMIKDWAVKYNLAVMVSLHAHMGSQNGMDHSAPVKMGKVSWGQTPDTVENSLQVVTFLAERYRKSAAFLGINLMNEPNTGVSYQALLQYYQDAYKQIRAMGNQCIIGLSPLLSDQGPPTMSNFMRCPEYYNVWHEYHIYYKWGWELAGAQAIISGALRYEASHIDPWTGNPLFIGEWSLATPDNTKLTKDQLMQLAANELDQYEAAPPGWAFWSWRHDDENSTLSGWSMRQMLREGVFTVPKATANRSSRILTKFCPYNDTSSSTMDDSASTSASGSAGSLAATAVVHPNKVEGDSGTSNLAVATNPVREKVSAGTTLHHWSRPLLVTIVSMLVAAASSS